MRMKQRMRIDAYAERAVEDSIKRALNPALLRQLTERAKEAVAGAFTVEFIRQLQDEALANIAADPNVIGVVRGLAHDIAEDTAKSYVAHVLGAAITVELGAIVDGAVIAGAKPVVPPLSPGTAS